VARASEIPHGRGLCVRVAGIDVGLFRADGRIWAMENRCPHAGHELNLQPNEFLTSDGELLMCRSHGARFRVEDGLCVLGPCPGAALRSFAVDVVEGIVVAQREELARIAAPASR